ncbi:aspartate/glutamate racemase family protein [Photobacterium rosenbergii]|uniref:Aspartate racemase n=1 Tax=Photobacterium rosenbergii TaxID=294936 RepID=A0A2T3NH24_9GAMM|nr:amino acid racemase [Photobacterium rosenbergii]MBY5943886.1 amino acid racemase [Photobacterium rosenbergii]PSW14270.1 aspartate racemase [Photobacterium rosenbergii]
MSRKLGILGGMGPLATVEFMQKIIAQTPACSDQQHIPMLVSNNPQIPDRTAFLISNGDDPYPALKQGMEQLEQAGAECIVMPCNTAHYWYPRLSNTCRVHMISILDSVVDEAKLRGYTKVGIMATTATMTTRMYETKLAQKQIAAVAPEQDQQQAVMDGIYAVKAGDVEQGHRLMKPVFDSLLEQGADAVILGCTEIPVALAETVFNQPEQCLDSLNILAKACIDWAMADSAELVA